MKTFIISIALIFGNQFCQAVNGLTTLPNPLVVNQIAASMVITNNGIIYCGFELRMQTMKLSIRF